MHTWPTMQSPIGRSKEQMFLIEETYINTITFSSVSLNYPKLLPAKGGEETFRVPMPTVAWETDAAKDSIS